MDNNSTWLKKVTCAILQWTSHTQQAIGNRKNYINLKSLTQEVYLVSGTFKCFKLINPEKKQSPSQTNIEQSGSVSRAVIPELSLSELVCFVLYTLS